MKKATRNILLAVCFAAVILPMLAGKPSAADKRKAEYAFMEAISKKRPATSTPHTLCCATP